MGWAKLRKKIGRGLADLHTGGLYEAERKMGLKEGDLLTAGYSKQMRDAQHAQEEMLRQQEAFNEQQLALARAQAAQTPEATQATDQDALGKLLKKRTALQRSITTRGAGQKLGD